MRTRTKFLVLALCAALWVGMIANASQAADNVADQILKATGVKGGLIVHLGCGDGRLTAALRANDSYVVHGLDASADNVARARSRILSLGLYGKVSVEQFAGERLPYTDSLVNLLVSENLGPTPMSEVMRVLCPNGVAYIKKGGKWTKTIKPWPKEMDEWTHSLYDSTNNAVAHDSLVGPPYHLQWVGAPRNARHHERLASVSVVVSASGRLFYIIDEAPTASILLRPQWSLVARDAFNGVILWKRKIPRWESYMQSFRSGPAALSRRLVAVKDRVYVTLGIQAPISALDAATGDTVRTYDGTEGASEILCHEDAIFAVINEQRKRSRSGKAPQHAKTIMAINAETGRTKWRASEPDLLPMTLAVSGRRVFYQTSEAIFCLDSMTGDRIWRYDRPAAARRPLWSAPTLVAYGDVVLSADRRADLAPRKKSAWNAAYNAGGPGELIALAADTGKRLWATECAETFHAPVDVFVADGLVWVGQSRLRRDEDFTAGRDPLTGEVKKRLSTKKAFTATMPHHRCYRNRATDRYLVLGRTGVEFIGIETGEALRHHWVRGVCQYGVIPCNGRLYAPPHSCACYIEAKLAGFYALAPKRSEERESSDDGSDPARLMKGPAYGQVGKRASKADDPHEWPTYRHDAARSGYTTALAPADLRLTWKADLGGKLSSPVVADAMVFVASVDTHTIYALDARNGNRVWRYTAGGRIDSPPTIAKRRVVFGSADGWVYCLRLSDGELAWRFRAAPEERRASSFGQLESVWPVHGSVLINDDAVYCAAGRSSYIDGGIHLCKLDLETGNKLAETRIYSRDPKTGEQPKEPDSFEMPGAKPDVLSYDGGLVYMRHKAFDPESLEERTPRPHLYSPAGFLNDDWWHRTYWIYGTHFYSGYIGWYFAGREAPGGRIMAIDESTIYGFGYQPDFYRGATGRKYHLFAADKGSQPAQPPHDYRRASREYPARGKGKFGVSFRWSEKPSILGRAMVVAGETLYVSGPPARALRSKVAFDGKKGGLLYVAATEDGKTLKEYRLDSPPVFDGLIAANGSLYMTTQNGKVLCAGSKGAPIPEAAAPKKRAASGKPIEPSLVGYWKLDGEEEETAIDSSGMGNDAEVYGRWEKGKFGVCLATDGAPGALTLPDGPYLHFDRSDFSIEFWIKVDAFEKRIMGKENYPKTWWVINLLKDGRTELVLGETNKPGKMVRPTSKTPLPKDKWRHVAYVVDRKNLEVRCYMNGSLDSRTKIPPTLTGSLSVEGRDLKIPSSFRPFVGLFDNLRIYKRALTEQEIKESYEKEKDNRF